MGNQMDTRFQVIIDASSDGIVVVDRTDIIQFINPAAVALLGYSSALLGSKFEFPTIPGEATEQDIVCRDGTQRAVELQVTELEWEGKAAYLVSLRDITRRKQTQNELQALYNAVSYLFESDNLQDLGSQIAAAVVQEFNHVDCGVLLVDKNEGKIIRLARAGEFRVEATRDLYLGGPGLVPEAIHTQRIVYVPDIASDSRYVMNHPQTQSELAIPLNTRKGTLGALDLQSTRVNAFSETQQRILSAFAERAATAIENMQLYEEVNRHITELEWRVALRTADMARSKERVEAILNNASDAIILAHPDGIIEQTNPAFFELFGWTTIEMAGIPLSHLFEDNHLALEEALMRASRDNLPTRVEVTGQKRNGRSFVAEMAISPYFQAEDQAISVICSLREITERKHMEEDLRKALEREKELSELKSRFVSTASHEFRTPLATIQSSADLLADYRHRMDENQIDEKIDAIIHQVQHLTTIMDDILDLGRLQSGRTEFKPVGTDIDALCRAIVHEFQSRSDVKRELHYTSQHIPIIAKLDKTLMRQVISNLVSNALKYSPPDKSVSLSLERVDDAVELRVRDRGIGIPEADLRHLFEPFHRGANVGTIPGTGLGLSIIKQAVEMHGGTIKVESEVGTGTTFVVSIPPSSINGDTDAAQHTGEFQSGHTA